MSRESLSQSHLYVHVRMHAVRNLCVCAYACRLRLQGDSSSSTTTIISNSNSSSDTRFWQRRIVGSRGLGLEVLVQGLGGRGARVCYLQSFQHLVYSRLLGWEIK